MYDCSPNQGPTLLSSLQVLITGVPHEKLIQPFVYFQTATNVLGCE